MYRNMRRYFAVLLVLTAVPLQAAAAQLPMLFYGEASWYGGRYQGRKTASGEIFDTNKLTAAHRQLPFGTLVRVVNLQNEKSVVVRINDRGPFVKNRVIDLSFAAAQALGFERQGTANVEVRVLKLGDTAQSSSAAAGTGTTVALRSQQAAGNDGSAGSDTAAYSSSAVSSSAALVPTPVSGDSASSTAAVTVPPAGGGSTGSLFRSAVSGFVIQAGAFTRRDNATRAAEALRSSGLDAFVYTSGRFYRVWVGGYSDRSEADRVLEQVRRYHRSAFIRRS